MGRTLHFDIKKDNGNFSIKELKIMHEVSEFYNSKEFLKDINKAYKTKLKEIWTCENFWVGADFFPNWKNENFANKHSDFVWDFINKEIEKLENKGMHYVDAVKVLHDKKMVNCSNFGSNEVHGFVKTQGNEFNSLLVLKALVQISKKLPKVTITLRDEGRFLLCELIIKQGKVLPNIQEKMDDLRNYALKMLFSKNFEGNILSKLETTDFDACFKGDMGLENGYGDMTNYINQTLKDLKEIENALIKAIGKNLNSSSLYFYNIETRSPKDYFEPTDFVRPVDVMKFLDYKSTTGKMMDGFHGEGFGLSTEDSEKESYEAIARLMSMFSGAGIDKKNIKVIGQENEE